MAHVLPSLGSDDKEPSVRLHDCYECMYALFLTTINACLGDSAPGQIKYVYYIENFIRRGDFPAVAVVGFQQEY